MSTTAMPSSPVGWGDRLKLRLSAIVWFLLALGFLMGLPVLLDVSILVVLAVVVVALLLAFPAAWLVRKLFAGQRLQRWAMSYVKAFLALLFGITALIAAPLYYLALRTDLQPLTVPQATLSNGTKTVVFQGMMHIGSEGFYKSVVYDLEDALSQGYVLYYEGVRGDPAGDAWFSRTLAGGGDLSTNYKQFGDACGLNFQLDYFGLLAADMATHPDRHVAADVSTADMMQEYERLVATDPAFAAAVTIAAAPESEETGTNSVASIFDLIASATPGQREIIGTACRGWMTMMLGQKSAPSPLDPVILDFRNRKLADRILADSHDKIYITYGAAHLPGLLDDLQASDPAWAVKSLKWLRTIETPEDLEGEL